ncbi:FAD-binding oxidoreductase [Oceanicella actignis]|uniref:FAD-binding oxidoreductase n=1 Tax=Oceanicella actignis TaxID=1189325 RepID=UPI0011E78A13|nr:FAD-linked oxidase C-terminal domain-containing protein [Oceanicella actignis]TYO91544.1 D-lactate dehydrogenase (cytochrome) [Oceanicella actignis]
MSIENAIERLEAMLGPRLSTAAAIREHHGRNETYYPVTPPDAVAFPETTEEVAAIVRLCAEERCPIVPWGVGTSLEGHALAFEGGLSLDMSRMDRILEVHEADMDAVVQPGVTRKRLNEELRATGLFFPVDPGADATLGGMAATRASGTNAVRYGTMRDNVLALEAVLADGRVIRAGTRARKSSSGYDLKNLIVGSEGTLAVITELTVRLHGQPEAVSAATCAFETVGGAVNACIETIQSGIPVARIEFLDAASIAAFNDYAGFDLPVRPHLFLEFHGSEAGVAEQAARFGEIADEHGAQGFRWTSDAQERNRLWSARHNAYFAFKAQRPGARALTTDVCVPISRLAEAIEAAAADIAQSRLSGSILGHVGDGNFHVAYLLDPDSPEDLEEARRLTHRMNLNALALGGTVTGEHGVGRGKIPYMAAEHGEAWQVMAQIKRTLDPLNILNPGKVVQIN